MSTPTRPIPRRVDSLDPPGARYAVAKALQDVPRGHCGTAVLLADDDSELETVPLCACNGPAVKDQLIVVYGDPDTLPTWHLHIDREAGNGHS